MRVTSTLSGRDWWHSPRQGQSTVGEDTPWVPFTRDSNYKDTLHGRAVRFLLSSEEERDAWQDPSEQQDKLTANRGNWEADSQIVRYTRKATFRYRDHKEQVFLVLAFLRHK